MSVRAPWPAEQKQEALRLANEVGIDEAAAVTRIPASTIRSWRHRTAQRALAAVELVRPTTGRSWSARRDQVVTDFADCLDLARSKLAGALQSGPTKQAKDLTVIASILSEKCEFLSGGATARTETLAVRGTVEEAEALLRTLGAKTTDELEAADELPEGA